MALIIYEMREHRLRWFGSVLRRDETETVRLVMRICDERNKGR